MIKKESMQINSGFLLQHFIRHLNKFEHLYIKNQEWSNSGFLYITLSDGERYSLSKEYWNQVIKLVNRFNELQKMVGGVQ